MKKVFNKINNWLRRNPKKLLLIALWIVTTFLVLSLCFTGLNAPDTIAAIFGFLGIATWIIISINTDCFTDWTFIKLIKNKKKMKKFFKLFSLMAMVGLLMTSCVTKVDPAAEGIKVKLVGSERGVDDVTLISGWAW